MTQFIMLECDWTECILRSRGALFEFSAHGAVGLWRLLVLDVKTFIGIILDWIKPLRGEWILA